MTEATFAQRRRIALTVAVGSMLVIAWMMQSFAAGPVWFAGVVFALVFNTTMIFLASEGILSMAIGALCHQGSSLFVILNSMRLLLVARRSRLPHVFLGR